MRIAALAVIFYSLAAHAAPLVTESNLHAGALSGTMLRPKDSGAAILIVPASGPTNRDGNNPLGVKGSPYKRLAETLAKRGLTTIRVDKRGMFGSAAATANANAVTMADYAEDVRAWLKTIRKATGLSCVWVAGHSEGGLVALVASQKPDGICGLILLAAPGRPVGDVLRDQLQHALGHGPVFEEATAAIKTLEHGKRPNINSMHPALRELFAPEIQGLLMSMFSYDPARLISGFHKPVLILQGERDVQVSVEDAKRLGEAAPSSKLVLLRETNHMLKKVASTDLAPNKAPYATPDAPLAPGLADAIAEFVLTGNSAR